MDYARLRELAYSVYPEGHAYSFDECMDILECFFDNYEYFKGEEHPMLRREQLRRIIENLPFTDNHYRKRYEDILPECYPDLIDAYFRKHYKANDYRINHFMSGRIREILMYENGFY